MKKILLTLCIVLAMAVTASCATLKWNASLDCQDTYYAVTAYDAAGNESVKTNEVSTNSDCDTTGYKVYWGAESGKLTQSKDVGNVLTYETEDLATGTLTVQ